MLSLILLVIHITAGSIALLTAFVALVTAKGGVIHVRAGRVYAIGMTVIFLTAVPLAALGANVFLLLIAFFSFYLVFAGWRFARNRSRRATRGLDRRRHHGTHRPGHVGLRRRPGTVGQWSMGDHAGVRVHSRRPERGRRVVFHSGTQREPPSGRLPPYPAAPHQHDGRHHRHRNRRDGGQREPEPGVATLAPAHHRHHSAHRMVECEDDSAGTETTRRVPRGVNVSTRYC